jgi:hypothetical protein
VTFLRIGYWREPGHPSWPDPTDLVDESWDPSERDTIASYLDDGATAKTWMGRAQCRFCGKLLGCSDLTDGTFIWPEGLSHYLSVHAVRLPQSFVQHAIRTLDEFESAVLDDSWWVSSTARPQST